jgi:hypothetical protein
MPEIAEKGVQFPWTCQWVRLASQFVGIPEQADDSWVCVRPRRGRLTVECAPPYVTEEECARCEFWEPNHQPEGRAAW